MLIQPTNFWQILDGSQKLFPRIQAREAAAESLTQEQLAVRLVDAGIGSARAWTLISVGGAIHEEIDTITEAINVRPVDLMVPVLKAAEEVVVRYRMDSVVRSYPD